MLNLNNPNIEKIVSEMNSIAKEYEYAIFFERGTIFVRQIEPDFFTTGIVPVFSYTDDNVGLSVRRFSVEFSGFGTRSEKEENIIFEGIKKAKMCANALNKFIGERQ